MWGVFKFKQGLGGKVIQTIGAWDYSNKKIIYWAYLIAMPKIIKLLKLIKKKSSTNSIDGNFG